MFGFRYRGLLVHVQEGRRVPAPFLGSVDESLYGGGKRVRACEGKRKSRRGEWIYRNGDKGDTLFGCGMLFKKDDSALEYFAKPTHGGLIVEC